MNKKLFTIIIIITAIALTGIIVTQFFWVKDALKTKNEQFNQNTHLGLKRVVNQLMVLQRDSLTSKRYQNNDEGANYHTRFIESLELVLLKRMINSEFKNLELCRVYYFGIYDMDTHEFVLLSDSANAYQLLNSEHKATISCVFQKDQYVLTVYFPLQHVFVFNNMQLYVSLSGIFMLIVIVGFWLTARSYLKQKKLTEMKTDFVNNMTHELKTPIATISISSEMLKKDEVQQNRDRVDKYANIIFNENERLKHQVDSVLQVAVLERKNYDLKLKNLNIHELIEQAINRFELSVKGRNGFIKKRLNAANSNIFADTEHFTNVLNNLLDNAIKYSPDGPEISVSTHSSRKGVFITIDDCGIGMEQDQLKNIFKQFHRVPTGDLHDVKGFGLGLYYVKSILHAHGGNIKVSSTIGKGSSFTIFFPLINNIISTD